MRAAGVHDGALRVQRLVDLLAPQHAFDRSAHPAPLTATGARGVDEDMPETYGKRQRRDARARKIAAREERRVARNQRRDLRSVGITIDPEPDELPATDRVDDHVAGPGGQSG
jgi:hypothetical protein